jgi:hypothetical protein
MTEQAMQYLATVSLIGAYRTRPTRTGGAMSLMISDVMQMKRRKMSVLK